jgi:hypothetical protein
MSLSIFVLSHDEALLAAVTPRPALRPVDLRDLHLPDAVAGNSLAESRFFLSERALDVTTEYVGVLSARHDEKYADRGMLTLDQLAQCAITPYLRPRRVFAPMATRPGGRWVERSDLAHPGLTALVREAAEEIPGVDFSRPTLFANSFVVHRSAYVEFVGEFRRIFEIFHARYGLDFPHVYRCSTCGTVSDDGQGRYQRDRHAAYFYERVTALCFARPQVDVVGLRAEMFMSSPRFAREVWRSARGQVARYRRGRLR